MGQYYKIVNLDKQEYLHGHKMDSGIKLMELGGTPAMALLVLCADGNGRGGGDFGDRSPNSVAGRWAGDRIVVAGDYADKGRHIPASMRDAHDDENLYDVAEEHFADISELVMESFRRAGEV